MSLETSISEHNYECGRKTLERVRSFKATGPFTPGGKAVSCMNSLKHGLTGQFRVLASESQEEFDLLVAVLMEEHDPQTPHETLLVTNIAKSQWLYDRALRLQTEALDSGEIDTHKLALFLRYQTTNERALYRFATELAQLQMGRLEIANQFVSQMAAEERLHIEVENYESNVRTQNHGRERFERKADHNDHRRRQRTERKDQEQNPAA